MERCQRLKTCTFIFFGAFVSFFVISLIQGIFLCCQLHCYERLEGFLVTCYMIVFAERLRIYWLSKLIVWCLELVSRSFGLCAPSVKTNVLGRLLLHESTTNLSCCWFSETTLIRLMSQKLEGLAFKALYFSDSKGLTLYDRLHSCRKINRWQAVRWS